MVPVAATLTCPVSEPLDSASMIPRVIARPADGPPMSAVLIETSTGKCQSYACSGSMPMVTVRVGVAGQPVCDAPAGTPAITMVTRDGGR